MWKLRSKSRSDTKRELLDQLQCKVSGFYLQKWISYVFLLFDFWGWGQNINWGQTWGQNLIGNMWIYYNKKFQVPSFTNEWVITLKKYLWGCGQNGGWDWN